jgi:uncharacterized protein with HEPN domain/predicted nucleotidyltransferase
VFGSAVSESFDDESSDVDVLVEFETSPQFDYFDSYFALKECLEGILERPVDVVSVSSIRNPYFLEQVMRTRETLYQGETSFLDSENCIVADQDPCAGPETKFLFSMRRDPRAYLWDAMHAAELLTNFKHGKSFADYQAEDLLRSGIERQFEIIGEALNQLSKYAPEVAKNIPDLPRIMAFRNILIHGYATVDDHLVWQLLVEKLPALQIVLRGLLDAERPDSEPTS